MILFFIILISILPTSLFAYLDPGTGAVLVNLLIAGIASAVFFFKGLFMKVLQKGSNEIKEHHDFNKIAILSEGKQYWSTFQPIVQALIDKKKCFSFYTLDVEDPALLIENEWMKARFLGFGRWAHAKASRIKAKILLCTTPNIGTPGYPIGRPENVNELIHVFHSICDISMYKIGSLDHYDSVIMVGDFQEESIRKIEKIRKLPLKKLISLGLPYLDDLIKRKKDRKEKKVAKTILIGSSWGQKGCLQSYGSDFIKEISKKGYDVIIRPHPQSFITEKGMIEDLKKELINYTNIRWHEEISPAQAMNEADILVSDTSSIRFDFAFLYEKPVITLSICSEEMPGYERDFLETIWSDLASEKIGFTLSKQEVNNINKFVERALVEYNSSVIKSFRNETVCNFGKAGEAIADFLSESIKEE